MIKAYLEGMWMPRRQGVKQGSCGKGLGVGNREQRDKVGREREEEGGWRGGEIGYKEKEGKKGKKERK